MIVSDRALLEQVEQCLPLGSTIRAPADDDRRFAVISEGDTYTVTQEGDVIRSTDDLGIALLLLANHLLLFALVRARDVLFVHAGVVGYRDRAIVLPGATKTGKTTLVIALLRAGAEYYTDDYMALAPDGTVHPYPLALLLRDHETGKARLESAQSLGATVGGRPLPIGTIAQVHYQAGAPLRLDTQSAAAGMMMLLGSTFGADLRPSYALASVREAVSGALVLDGQRDGADEAARALLELSTQAG